LFKKLFEKLTVRQAARVSFGYASPNWTGSFNFTKNAGYSLENALIVRDKRIVSAYVNEFAQVAAVSEPLDWETSWSNPQHFIGS